MSIGIWQLVLILVIVIIIFGAGRLPRAMGDLGKSIRALRSGLKGEGEEEEPSPDNPAKPAPNVLTSQESEAQTESKARLHEKQTEKK